MALQLLKMKILVARNIRGHAWGCSAKTCFKLKNILQNWCGALNIMRFVFVHWRTMLVQICQTKKKKKFPPPPPYPNNQNSWTFHADFMGYYCNLAFKIKLFFFKLPNFCVWILPDFSALHLMTVKNNCSTSQCAQVRTEGFQAGRKPCSSVHQ